MNNLQRFIASACAAALSLAGSAAAHPLSPEQCTEGSDFIKNAALFA